MSYLTFTSTSLIWTATLSYILNTGYLLHYEICMTALTKENRQCLPRFKPSQTYGQSSSLEMPNSFLKRICVIRRVSYGEITGLTDEQLREILEMKFEAFLPGPKPSKGSYTVQAFSPYKIHQRCVDSMVSGRVVLAGDAAHLVNPFGGTGLTGGMCDGGGLADCLIAIFKVSPSVRKLDDTKVGLRALSIQSSSCKSIQMSAFGSLTSLQIQSAKLTNYECTKNRRT